MSQLVPARRTSLRGRLGVPRAIILPRPSRRVGRDVGTMRATINTAVKVADLRRYFERATGWAADLRSQGRRRHGSITTPGKLRHQTV